MQPRVATGTIAVVVVVGLATLLLHYWTPGDDVVSVLAGFACGAMLLLRLSRGGGARWARGHDTRTGIYWIMRLLCALVIPVLLWFLYARYYGPLMTAVNAE